MSPPTHTLPHTHTLLPPPPHYTSLGLTYLGSRKALHLGWLLWQKPTFAYRPRHPHTPRGHSHLGSRKALHLGWLLWQKPRVSDPFCMTSGAPPATP